MNKISGIKSVDFKIEAVGHGVVNWNGSMSVVGDDGKEINNHTFPKLRGYTNLNGKVKETGYKYKKEASDIDFKETPLYISQNCIKNALFKSNSFLLQEGCIPQMDDLLASIVGLVRGYVVTHDKSGSKRKSPLLITDFVDQLGNGNFENMSRHGSKAKEVDKKNNTFFTKTTFGDTKYIGWASLNIEDLQFISLSKQFERPAMEITSETQGIALGKKIEEYLKSIDASKNPTVTFHKNYVRIGSIHNGGEQGLLLNDDAIDILVNEVIDMFKNLNIVQGKGYMSVANVVVDYNNGTPLRLKRNTSEANGEKSTNYAQYYIGK